MTTYQNLFKSFEIDSLQLRNRIIMAPMTRSMSKHHIPGPDVAAYYKRRAEGGVGLIISEGTTIDHKASHGYPDVPNFHGKEALEGWKKVIDGVHQAGGKMFPQLWHVGSVRQCNPHQNSGIDNPDHVCCQHQVPGYAPSAIVHPYVPGGEIPHEMTLDDIKEVIASYARSAQYARELGFDGIEIHGAHGYLIDQFFWEVTNKRTDEYGGKTAADRTRFGVEVVKAVRKAVGKEFPIMFRFSQFKLGDYQAKLAKTSEELDAFLQPLSLAGVDIFHCSTRDFSRPEFDNSPLNLAGWTKKLSGKPTVTVGSIGLDKDFISTFKEGNQTVYPTEIALGQLEQSLEHGEYDLAAVGRALLSDPEWAHKVEQGKFDQIRPFSKELLTTLY